MLGNYILLVFGKQYSTEGFTLLRVLSLCSIIIGFNYILSVLLIVFRQIKFLIISSIVYAISLFSASYFLIQFGIVGIGYATILSQLLLASLNIFCLAKAKKLFVFNSLLKI